MLTLAVVIHSHATPLSLSTNITKSGKKNPPTHPHTLFQTHSETPPTGKKNTTTNAHCPSTPSNHKRDPSYHPLTPSSENQTIVHTQEGIEEGRPRTTKAIAEGSRWQAVSACEWWMESRVKETNATTQSQEWVSLHFLFSFKFSQSSQCEAAHVRQCD